MYWDPFEDLDKMHEDMDRMFRRIWGHPDRLLIGQSELPEKSEMQMRTPICHLHETENNIVAAIELPGVDKGDIDLTVDDTYIQLKVESKHEKKQNSEHGRAYSSFSQSFYRRIPLPKEVESAKATAEYRDGILRVEVPKKKDSAGKKVRVE